MAKHSSRSRFNRIFLLSFFLSSLPLFLSLSLSLSLSFSLSLSIDARRSRLALQVHARANVRVSRPRILQSLGLTGTPCASFANVLVTRCEDIPAPEWLCWSPLRYMCIVRIWSNLGLIRDYWSSVRRSSPTRPLPKSEIQRTQLS